MEAQQTFKYKISKQSPIKIYYANVRDVINNNLRDIKNNKIIKEEELTSANKQKELEEVIYSLSKGSGGNVSIDELNRMDTEVKYWIESLISGHPSIDYEHIVYLINSFCKEFRTRQRETDKYVLLILSQNRLLLAHSRGEKGLVGIKDALKIAELLLAFGNVTRYVEFLKEDNKIKCNYHELSKSGFFIRFLGISFSEQIYYLSDITVYTEFHGLESAFHFSRREFEEKFILPESPEYVIRNNQLIFSSGTPLSIKYIRMGRGQYKDSEKFEQDFMMAYYELDHYNNYYKSLYTSLENKIKLLEPLPIKYNYIDERDRLIKVESANKVTEIPKISDKFVILFADENIRIDSSFLRELKQKYCFQEKVRVYLTSSKFISNPVVIGSYEIYNDIGVGNEILEVIKQINKIIKDSDSAFIKNSLYHALFNYLHTITNHQIKWFFKSLFKSFLEDIQIEEIIVSEDENDAIEFKRRDWFSGNSGKARELAEKVSGDILTKIKDSSGKFKIYFIGFDQNTKQPDLLGLREWDTERVGRLREELKIKLNEKINLQQLFFTQVPVDNKCYFILLVKGNLR